MEQNKKSSIISPWLWTAIVVVILIVAGYFVWAMWNKTQSVVASNTTSAPTIQPTAVTSPSISPSTSASSISTADWKTYTNIKYSFSLTFPNDSWKNYKVIEFTPADNSAVKYLYFAVPTTDSAWNELNGQKGYASPFAVSVYTPAQWKEAQKIPYVNKKSLGQNSKYIFTVTGWQDSPKDLVDVDFGWTSIDSSFKATQ